MTYLTIVLPAGLASLGLQGVLLPFQRRYLVEVPNGRSSHPAPTARGGGISVVVGAWLGVALPWNLPRARVLLGDVGSYAIGTSLAVLALWTAAAGVPLWTAFAPLLVYVLDTGWTLARRILSGRPWSEAHREHVYQRLVDGGWSHTQSALVSAAAALMCCAAATVTGSVGMVVGALILVIGTACYLLLPNAIHGARTDAVELTKP